MIDVLTAALLRTYNPLYKDRTWLGQELPALIAAKSWALLGGLLVHVVVAQAPVPNLAARVAAATALAPRTESPAWSSESWVSAELTAHVAPLVASDSDLVALALRMAGVVARVELS